jgi:hypothetical protein
MAITNATKLAGYVGGLLVGDGTTGSFAARSVTGDAISALGVIISGVATATGGFSGNLTGTASTITGDSYVGIDTSTGVILKSPNGTSYRLYVENDGTLKTVSA